MAFSVTEKGVSYNYICCSIMWSLFDWRPNVSLCIVKIVLLCVLSSWSVHPNVGKESRRGKSSVLRRKMMSCVLCLPVVAIKTTRWLRKRRALETALHSGTLVRLEMWVMPIGHFHICKCQICATFSSLSFEFLQYHLEINWFDFNLTLTWIAGNENCM